MTLIRQGLPNNDMDELIKLLPPEKVLYATAGWLLIQNLGRIFHAWKAEGGWRGIRNALIFGTNTPSAKETQAIDTANEKTN